MKDKLTIKDVSHVLAREIQAPLVSSLIKGFADEFGEEKAKEVAKRIIEQDAVKSGSDLAEKFGGNSLSDLLEIVKKHWAKDGTMEIENIELGKDHLNFDVTKCGYAEVYEKLGLKDLGLLMSCCRDFPFMDGFNPAYKLVRTKTIMEGDDCCDFRYCRR